MRITFGKDEGAKQLGFKRPRKERTDYDQKSFLFITPQMEKEWLATEKPSYSNDKVKLNAENTKLYRANKKINAERIV